MMRVVLDTNLVISGLLWSGSPRDVLNNAQARVVETITSEALVDELRDVIHRQKFVKYFQRLNRTPEELINQYLAYTTVVEPAFVLEDAVRDLKDVKVLEAAVGGSAVIIVSGDEDLLVLKIYDRIEVLSARDFLARLHPNDET